MCRLKCVGLAVALLATSLWSATVHLNAQETAAFDRRPKDCIAVASIDGTDVSDDQTILFFLRGAKIYRNHLPRTCRGLKRADVFVYAAASGRLCANDLITVVEPRGGGLSCSLGKFNPVSEDELEELTAEPGDESAAIEVEVVKLPPAQNMPGQPDTTAPRDQH